MNSLRSRPAPRHSGPAEGAVAEFEALYRANVAAVTAYFARRSAEPHTVADLTADTFVAAITSFATFDPRKGTARAWVFGIARRIYAAHCQEHGQQRSRVERLAGRRELAPDEIGDLIDSDGHRSVSVKIKGTIPAGDTMILAFSGNRQTGSVGAGGIITGPVPTCVSLPGPPDGGSPASSSVTPPG
jgi:RNA polymerase sigma-70 factor (ECF subfamily)